MGGIGVMARGDGMMTVLGYLEIDNEVEALNDVV